VCIICCPCAIHTRYMKIQKKFWAPGCLLHIFESFLVIIRCLGILKGLEKMNNTCRRVMHCGMMDGHSVCIILCGLSIYSFAFLVFIFFFLNVCSHEYRSCEQSFISLLFLLVLPVATFCWVSCTFCKFLSSMKICACFDWVVKIILQFLGVDGFSSWLRGLLSWPNLVNLSYI